MPEPSRSLVNTANVFDVSI